MPSKGRGRPPKLQWERTHWWVSMSASIHPVMLREDGFGLLSNGHEVFAHSENAFRDKADAQALADVRLMEIEERKRAYAEEQAAKKKPKTLKRKSKIGSRKLR